MATTISTKQFKTMLSNSATTMMFDDSLSREEYRKIKQRIEKIYNKEISDSLSESFGTCWLFDENDEEIYLGEGYDEINLTLDKINRKFRKKKINRLL